MCLILEIPEEPPCPGCPFNRPMTPVEVADAREEAPGEVMLCHESGCLDGEGVEDYPCRGWQKAILS